MRRAERLGSGPAWEWPVDDNRDGGAIEVCSRYEDAFDLKLSYRRSGEESKLMGRNIEVEAASKRADWIAMTADDCLPVADWLSTDRDTGRRATVADALTGICIRELSDTALKWLTSQPFLEGARFRFEDRTPMKTAATNNSFFRAQFFRERPWLQFEPELGIVGGEDMVFFRTANKEGLSICFAAGAAVYGIEPPERETFQHQLQSHFWLGNTEYVTNRYLGEARPAWWLLRGAKLVGSSAVRPLAHLVRGQTPEFRYAAASALRGLGMIFGASGLKLRHH